MMVIIMVKTGKVTESVDRLNARNVHTQRLASSDKLETASAASVAMNGS